MSLPIHTFFLPRKRGVYTLHDDKCPLDLVFLGQFLQFITLPYVDVEIMPVCFTRSVQVKVEHLYEFVGVPKAIICL